MIRDKIINRVSIENGRVFCRQDFRDIATPPAISAILSKLAKEGILEKIGKGLYYYRGESADFDATPPEGEILPALERAKGIDIFPSGMYCANALGLINQVQAKSFYLTTGGSFSREICGSVFRFESTNIRRWPGISYKLIMIAIAISWIGAHRLSNLMLNKLRKLLSDEEINEILAINHLPHELALGFKRVKIWEREESEEKEDVSQQAISKKADGEEKLLKEKELKKLYDLVDHIALGGKTGELNDKKIDLGYILFFIPANLAKIAGEKKMKILKKNCNICCSDSVMRITIAPLNFRINGNLMEFEEGKMIKLNDISSAEIFYSEDGEFDFEIQVRDKEHIFHVKTGEVAQWMLDKIKNAISTS